MAAAAGDGAALRPLTYGFVGCGTISAAIVRGACRPRQGAPDGAGCAGDESGVVAWPVKVTRRSAAKTARLVEEFGPGRVSVCETNAEVVSGSDVVVIGLTPPVAVDVLPSLGLTDEHIVLNLVSTVTNDRLRELAGLSASAIVVKCVPLPPAAVHASVSVLYPHDAAIEALFSKLGTVVCVDTEDQLRVLQAATALMGPFYKTVVTAHQWMTDHGIPDGAAAAYSGAFFRSISADSAAQRDGAGLAHLVAEQTPGGLNEEAIRRHQDAGCYDAQRGALDAILERLATAAL